MMHVLFGPEHDRRHVDPAVSGAYEWWYFDALSDDSRYALVVIYFLGSPMSPYYKAVVDGKQPAARDWCGVFFSLHERRQGLWTERAYAYNLYQNGTFATERIAATVGSSQMVGESLSDDSFRWHLHVNERALWRGQTQAELAFVAPTLSPVPPPSSRSPGEHAWVCVAPDCRVEGTITMPSGKPLRFIGRGYHDHNFGTLPWEGIEIWYWARAHFIDAEGNRSVGICYDVEHTDGTAQSTTLLWQDSRIVQQRGSEATRQTLTGDARNAYGLRHSTTLRTESRDASFTSETDFRLTEGFLAEGPFYRRVPVTMTMQQNALTATGTGIGEIFRPARLCGPIAARAMWTRMRRRISSR